MSTLGNILAWVLGGVVTLALATGAYALLVPLSDAVPAPAPGPAPVSAVTP